jgi:DNA/RNA endonuclease G (NUC1)
MRRRIPPAFFVVIVLLLIVGRVLLQQGFIQHQPEHQYHQPHPQQTEQVHPAAPAPPPPSTAEGLTKYGNPVPHKLVGPYHILVNEGYVSGYNAGIQNPRWVETRFFAVSHPTSAGRPEGFSPDPRIKPEYQVNNHYWTRSGYDRGHMAPN